MKIEKRKIAQIILICLIFATVAFAFIQSSLSPEASSAESDAVGGIVEEIIPSDTPTGSYIQSNIRKIAHFVEFALLGAEAAVYILLFARKPIFVALSYPFALVTAVLDESIQMFSGRGPSISDVWIDFFGFLTLSLLVYIVFWGVLFVRKRFFNKKSEG